LDEKDVRIFCEMAFKYLDYSAFERRHASPLEIGRKLGLDEKTVRSRIRKMEEDGFIKYYQAVPNFSLFGLRNIGMYGFEAPDIPSKREAISLVLRSPSVVEVFDLLGPGFSATLMGPSPEQTRELAEDLGKKARVKTPSRISDRSQGGPSCRLGRLDWQIIEALRYDAMKSAKTIGDQLSITPRTADYRIDRLLRCKALFIRAVINAKRQQGPPILRIAHLHGKIEGVKSHS
jgi:DNA-binding Lrp family transcriptional regulator